MDLWNNDQGRQIANEIRKEFKNYKSMSVERLINIIACKVVQSMKAGKLITSLDDPRKYEEKNYIPTRSIGGINKNGIPLGLAAEIDEDSLENIDIITDKPKIQSKSVFSGYTNPITGNNRIYTREEIGKMSGKEYEENEEEIDAQLRSVGIPSNWDMEQEVKSGDVIYVNSYTRSDGTQVQGYYRSRSKN